jgi:hypothetical protein
VETYIGGALMVVGGLCLLIALIQLICIAFQEHVVLGIGVLILPWLFLPLTVFRWSRMWRPQVLHLVGIAFVLAGARVLGHPLHFDPGERLWDLIVPRTMFDVIPIARG